MSLLVMAKLLLGLVLLSVGCSGSDGEISCSTTDRAGAYVAHFTERANGSCGAIPDTVLRFSGGSGIGAGCRLDAPDVISRDQCTLERSATCPVAGTDQTLTIVASTRETESGGAKLAGVETVTAFDGTGAFLCTSTYDLSATRQ